jgi:hypothetical protein
MTGRLVLGRRDVAAGPVEALGVPPEDPGGCGCLDLVRGAPVPGVSVDQLGRVQPVDALGEGVVVMIV